MIKYLLSKASTGKFRVVYLSTTEEWDEEKAGFVINRVTGQLHGKMTEQPEIVITKGKAGRTHRVLWRHQDGPEWICKAYACKICR